MVRLLLLCCALIALAATACVKETDVDKKIRELVVADLETSYEAGIGNSITKTEILNDNFKIWLVDEFPADKIEPFCEVATRSYGTIARTNGKVTGQYIMQLYQKQMVKQTGKEKVLNVAEGTYDNAKDRVSVKAFGQGDGRYDY